MTDNGTEPVIDATTGSETIRRAAKDQFERGAYLVISAETEIELFRRWRDEGDEDAREAIVYCVRRLAYRVVRHRARNAGLNHLHDEIESASLLAIVFAMDRWDVSYGCRLSTYLTWWCLAHAGRIEGQLIHVPMDLKNEKTASKSESGLQRREQALGVNRRMRYLNKRLPYRRGDNSTEFGSLLEDKNTVDVAEEYDEKLMRLRLRWALSRLPKNDQTAARLCFLHNLTLEEAACEMGCTRERVRQVRARAVSQLQRYIEIAPTDERYLLDPDGRPFSLESALDDDEYEDDVWEFENVKQNEERKPETLEEPVSNELQISPAREAGGTPSDRSLSDLLDVLTAGDVQREMARLDDWFRDMKLTYHRRRERLVRLQQIVTDVPAVEPAGAADEPAETPPEPVVTTDAAARRKRNNGRRARKWPSRDSLLGRTMVLLHEQGEMSPASVATALNISAARASAILSGNRERYVYPTRYRFWRAATPAEVEEYWQQHYPGATPEDADEEPLFR